MGKPDFQETQRNNLGDFMKIIKQNPLTSIKTSDLVKPNGYAANIARNLKVTRVQLRKVYSELKYVFESVKQKGSIDDEMKTKMYMLYPILEYQKNRGVIDERFVELMNALLENLERHENKENFEQADRFLTALVAYTRKEY
jgi:CRISPR type III-A-associated protein Csm2